jgi:hypothetical protein
MVRFVAVAAVVITACADPPPPRRPAPAIAAPVAIAGAAPADARPDPPVEPEPLAAPEPDPPEPATPEPAPPLGPPHYPPRWSACPARTVFAGEIGVEAWCERKDGKRHGPYTAWDELGRLAEEGEFRAGRRHGQWIEYYEGAVAGQGPYRRGRKHGKWIHRGAHFTLEVTWKNGREVKWFERREQRQAPKLEL